MLTGLSRQFVSALCAFSAMTATPAAAGPESASGCAAALGLLSDNPEAALAALNSRPLGASCPNGAEEEGLLLAFAAYLADGEASRDSTALRRAIRDYEKAAGPSTRLYGMALVALAERNLATGSDDAFETAKKAEEVLVVSAPDDKALIAKSILRQAAAHLLRQPNFSSDTIAAFEHATRARAVFSGDGLHENPVYLETVAWQAAILGMAAGDPRATIDAADASAAMKVFGENQCADHWSHKKFPSVRKKLQWAGNLFNARRFLGIVVAVDATAAGEAEKFEVASVARFPFLDDPTEREIKAWDKAIATALKRWTISDSAPLECRLKSYIPLGSFISGYEESVDFLSGIPVNIGSHE